jgi:GAF domain-containing protein
MTERRMIAGGPITAIWKSPETIEWELRNAKPGVSKGPPKRPSIEEFDPQLVQLFREALQESGLALSMLAIAERIAAKMGAQLPREARLFPTHPSIKVIADITRAHTLAELESLFAHRIVNVAAAASDTSTMVVTDPHKIPVMADAHSIKDPLRPALAAPLALDDRDRWG